MKFFARTGSAASVRFSARTDDWTALEYIWPFCRTTMIPLSLELTDFGNWAFRTPCATCDSALVGPPKLDPATL